MRHKLLQARRCPTCYQWPLSPTAQFLLCLLVCFHTNTVIYHIPWCNIVRKVEKIDWKDKQYCSSLNSTIKKKIKNQAAYIQLQKKKKKNLSQAVAYFISKDLIPFHIVKKHICDTTKICFFTKCKVKRFLYVLVTF